MAKMKDPPKKGKTTIDGKDVYVNPEPSRYYKAPATMEEQNRTDALMAKQGRIPEVDSKGVRTNKYVNINDETSSLVKSREEVKNTPKDEVYVNDNPKYYFKSNRTMTAEEEERMRKGGYIQELDSSGKPTGAYTRRRNKTVKPEPEVKPEVKPEKPSYNKRPHFTQANDVRGGQFQSGEYIDYGKGNVKLVMFSPEQQKANYESLRIKYTGKKNPDGTAELSTATSRAAEKASFDRENPSATTTSTGNTYGKGSSMTGRTKK